MSGALTTWMVDRLGMSRSDVNPQKFRLLFGWVTAWECRVTMLTHKRSGWCLDG